jgi:hypothetical protein
MRISKISNSPSLLLVDEETADWLEKFRVVNAQTRRWIELTQPGKLAAYTFGHGGFERTRLASDLIAWLFLFDDAYADGMHSTNVLALQREHRRYDALLKGDFAAAPKNAFGQSLADLLRRFRATAPSSFVDRLGASIRLYLDGCELETSYRGQQRTPSIEGYSWYRDRSIGVYPMLDLIEYANDAYLTPHESRSPIVSALRRSASLLIAITNDVHSSRKEAMESESFNAVLVYQRQYNLARESAVESARALQERFRSEFEHFCDVCRPHASEGLLGLMAGVGIWEEGNERWSAECPRYNELSEPIDAFRPPPSAPEHQPAG